MTWCAEKTAIGWSVRDNSTGAWFQPNQWGSVPAVYHPGKPRHLGDIAKKIRDVAAEITGGRGRFGATHSLSRKLLCERFAEELNRPEHCEGR